MNIKEIIDNARTSLVYMDAGICDDALKQYENDVRRINVVLNRIEDAVMRHIKELEERLIMANKTIEALKGQTSILDLNQKPF